MVDQPTTSYYLRECALNACACRYYQICQQPGLMCGITNLAGSITPTEKILITSEVSPASAQCTSPFPFLSILRLASLDMIVDRPTASYYSRECAFNACACRYFKKCQQPGMMCGITYLASSITPTEKILITSELSPASSVTLVQF